MGLFDMFTKEGKLTKHVRRMSNRDALPEDRDASAHWLREEGSGKAIMGLLTRFDITITQGMKDRAEKEMVFGILTSMGDAVVPPLDAWLVKCKHYAWPLKLMVALKGQQAAVDAVYDLLDGPAGNDTFNPARRKELLVWLAENADGNAVARLGKFLKDFDEDVRYAASEVLIATNDEAARGPLLEALARPDEESLRLKHRLALVFKTRGWSVGDTEVGGLPDGFGVSNGRIVGT